MIAQEVFGVLSEVRQPEFSGWRAALFPDTEVEGTESASHTPLADKRDRPRSAGTTGQVSADRTA